ncbi:hypothetical protein HK413_14175 [Mucilaginibacter sp. S1162]|uniref:Uncharacterized protein n=1 Tax=Mucilaginibacter humi TaxID=2732510 RepID=A0ABX1W7E5_9SPHI|nr:hypothetical protein [Mucilaginibacter humi]
MNDKFRFDAGPSLLTMPEYIDELFTLAGRMPLNISNTKNWMLSVSIFMRRRH